jgi:hypothetical protein
MRFRARRLWLGGLAAAGVALSHEIAYRLAHADPVQRVHVLNQTGHDYMPVMAKASLLLGVLGLVFFVAQKFSSPTASRLSVAGVATRLFIFQACGYVLQELVERALSGHGLTLSLSPVLVALALQLLIAVVIALATSLLAATIDRFLRKPLDFEPCGDVDLPRGSADVTVLVPLSGGLGLRGPPPMVQSTIAA